MAAAMRHCEVALGGGLNCSGGLGGGGGRRTCDNGIGVDVGVDVVKAEGLLLLH